MTIRAGDYKRTADPKVEAELDRMPKMRVADLRARYRELFRAEPPKAFGPDLLRRSIAHRIQQRIKPGCELVRTWNRRTYRVVVLEKGFAHQGRTYQSLSEIASDITGTKWNGPRFFGLRRSSSEKTGDADAT
jgi:hypothetical protein